MKKQIRGLIKNKPSFALAVKVIIIIGVSYLLIQLSNKEKSIEETKYIPGMQNALDYAEHYITWKYEGDWEKLGHRLSNDGLYSLYLETNIKRLEVLRGEYSEFRLYAWFDSAQEEIDNGHSIRGNYDEETVFTVVFSENEESVLYEILYKNEKCVPNFEMEKRFGITTDEIERNIQQIYTLFETEMKKMHELQLEKVKRRRKNLTNMGFILFAVYLLLKCNLIMMKNSEENKYKEQCLGKAIANIVNKLSRWKYVLFGAVVMFWVYILRPVVSGIILFVLEGNLKIYLSYGISAIIVAAAGCFIIMRNSSGKSEKGTGLTLIWLTIQTAAGCILEMSIIRLGMILVSDFYPRNIQFYIVNGVAWCGAAFLIFVFSRIKCRIPDSRKNKFYN